MTTKTGKKKKVAPYSLGRNDYKSETVFDLWDSNAKTQYTTTNSRKEDPKKVNKKILLEGKQRVIPEGGSFNPPEKAYNKLKKLVENLKNRKVKALERLKRRYRISDSQLAAHMKKVEQIVADGGFIPPKIPKHVYEPIKAPPQKFFREQAKEKQYLEGQARRDFKRKKKFDKIDSQIDNIERLKDNLNFNDQFEKIKELVEKLWIEDLKELGVYQSEELRKQQKLKDFVPNKKYEPWVHELADSKTSSIREIRVTENLVKEQENRLEHRGFVAPKGEKKIRPPSKKKFKMQIKPSYQRQFRPKTADVALGREEPKSLLLFPDWYNQRLSGKKRKKSTKGK